MRKICVLQYYCSVICLSVTLVHHAKAIGWNETVPSNIVLDRGPDPPQVEEVWGSEPPVCSDAAYHQITLAVPFFRSYSRLGRYPEVNFWELLCEDKLTNTNITPVISKGFFGNFEGYLAKPLKY